MQIVIAHARYHVICTPYAKFGYIFEFPTPTLPIHYDAFIGLRWRIRGVYSWDPNVKREIERKFCPDQNGANFGGLVGLGVSGFKKFRFLLQKAHVFVNPRRLSHLASKLEKKIKKVTDSHRKDMSPLTQHRAWTTVQLVMSTHRATADASDSASLTSCSVVGVVVINDVHSDVG